MKKNIPNHFSNIGGRIIKTFCVAAVFLLLFTTCKVGLGETVDVNPPELSITYPSPAEKIIIRGEFAMTGTVSDDVIIKSVSVGFVGKENGIKYKYNPPNLAVVDVANKTWKITLNTPDTTDAMLIYPLKDAVYTVTVTATDNSGRKSFVSADYEIDNTAPVVVMQQPGSANADIPEAYGTLLKLTGQAADTNIEKLTFIAYEKILDGYVQIEDVGGNPVSTTIDLGGQAIKAEVGEFGAVDIPETPFNEGFYNDIYKPDLVDPTKNGAKTFFYTVQAFDKARVYNDPLGGVGAEAGNYSKEYYLFDETSAIVTADDLYKMHTGAYYTSSPDGTVIVDEAKELKAKSTLATLVADISGESFAPAIGLDILAASRLGVFTLYPSKFPTYSLVGMSAVTDENFDTLENNKVSTASPLVVELSPNKDGVPLDLDSVTIRALRLDKSSGIEPEQYSAEYRLHPVPAGEEVYLPTLSGGKYTFTMNQSGVKNDTIDTPNPLEVPKTDGTRVSLPVGSYIIEVTGIDKAVGEGGLPATDSEGNLVGVYDNGSVHYGFAIQSSNTPPAISLNTINDVVPESTTVYVKNDNLNDSSVDLLPGDTVVATIIGTVKDFSDVEGAELSSVTYTLKYEDEEIERTAPLEIQNVDIDPKLYDWQLSLTHKDFKDLYLSVPVNNVETITQKSATYTLIVYAKDPADNESFLLYSIYYDVENPLFTETDISHTVVAEKDVATHNKKITIKGTSGDDDKLSKGTYVVRLKDASGVVTKSIPANDPATEEEDTTEITTPGNFTFNFATKDIANADGSITDGTTVEVAVSIYDRVGNITTQTFTLDSIAPELSGAKVSAPDKADYIADGKNWYKENVLTVEITAEDSAHIGARASGVISVEWSTDTTTWHLMLLGLENKWTGNISMVDGMNTIQFRATDASLNVGTLGTPLVVYGDLIAPTTLTLATVDGEQNITNKLTNASADIEVVVNGAIDTAANGSGLKDVQLYKIGSTDFTDGIPSAPVAITGGGATIPITKEHVAAGTEGGVVFRLTDNVGHFTDFTLFSLNIDNAAPTASITEPAASIIEPIEPAKVNGIVTIRGIANDGRELTKVTLERKKDGAWVNTGPVTGTYGWTYELNTTEFANNTDLVLRAVVEDKAGNIGYSAEHTIHVAQDSDRPIVTLINVDLKDMTKDINKWLINTNKLLGTVNDDDGIVTKLEISTNAGMSYEPVTLSGTSWSYVIAADGQTTIFFRVTDSKGTVFTSHALVGATLPTGADLQTSPKLTDGTYKFGYMESTEKGSTVNLKVDNTPPAIGSQVFIDTTPGSSAGNWFNDTPEQEGGLVVFSPNMVLGGTKGTFSLQITAHDANNIEKIEILHATNPNPVATSTKVSSGEAADAVHTFETTVIGTANFPDGYVTLTVKVTDGSGGTSQRDYQIIVDNVAPTIQGAIIPAINEQLTGIIEVRGSATDKIPGAGLLSIQYTIPIPNSSDSWTVPPDTVWEDVTSGSDVWSILFDGDLKPTLASYVGGAETHGIETSFGSNIWRLPIVFRLEDKAGNVAVTGVEDYILRIDPDGNKPKVEVSDPLHTGSDNFTTLGGSIRIFGSAEDNLAVGAVYIQIDPNVHESFSPAADFSMDDFDKLKDMTKTNSGSDNVYPTNATNTATPQHADIRPGRITNFGAWWGIRVEGKNNWKATINASNEFDPTDNTSTKSISFRARSVDTDGALSEWSDVINIKVDKNAPQIGATNPLKLVQYADNGLGTGDRVAEQDYVSGMWLKGEWYLTGSIEDESDIATITLEGQISGSLANNSTWFIDKDYPAPSKGKGYDMNIPLSGDGNLSFTIKVEDGTDATPGRAERQISLNFDQRAPTITGDLKDNGGQTISTTTNTGTATATVHNDNTNFTFGATLTENGSGFSHIAFWFERDVDGDANDRIYNVMESRVGDANRTDLTRTTVPSGEVGIIDRLPRLHLAKVDRPTESTLSHATIKNDGNKNDGNKNVREGGLVKIGGVDRFITAVDYGTGTITFTPPVGIEHETADIAYVMVVNNQITETAVGTGGSAYIDGDDGDGMVERVRLANGVYTWTATIDSRNIPDGPIFVNYVVFDTAGNATSESEGRLRVESKVENNKPQIATIWLGTDLNGNGTIENTQSNEGETKEYSTLVGNKPTSTAIVNALSDINSFTAKGLTHVTPEIVGGNGKLYYSLTTNLPDGEADKTIDVNVSDTGTNIRASGGGDIAAATLPIVLGLTDGKLLGLEDTTGEAGRVFNFTIWDSTEETTAGSTSQNATLAVSMHVDAVDEVAPLTVITPFHWTAADDNSLYDNSRDNGHIELEADLPDTFIANNTTNTLFDKDPKVSGKISIRGTAYDDKSLNEIWASIDDFTFANAINGGVDGTDGTDGTKIPASMIRIAEYIPANATWKVGSSTMDAQGWKFTAEDVTFGQDGHTITWQLDWNSQKMDGIVGLDKTVTILSRDTTGNFAVVGTNGNVGADGYNKPTYRMDIVPYITDVTTNLSSKNKKNPTTNTRTALGKYPVYAGEIVTLTGFNMSTIDKVHIDTTQISPTEKAIDSLKVNIGTAAKSGDVKITVSGISGMTSLNNVNNNGTSVDNKVVVYNQTPNNANNNLLVDDVAFDVWGYAEAAKPGVGVIATPELRISPTGSIGLAFVNGTQYFNMPTNNATTTQGQIERSWAEYYESAMAFDPAGNVYALSTNLDTGEGYSAFTSFYFGGIKDTTSSNAKNRWGAQEANYFGGKNRQRIMATTSSSNPVTTLAKRVVSPSMAATGLGTNAKPSNIYFAYYDALKKEIKYQWGTVGSSASLELEVYSVNSTTITTDSSHGFVVGQQVTFTKGTGNGAAYNPSWNNVYTVKSVDGSKAFTIDRVSGDDLSADMRVSAIAGQIMDIRGGWSDNDKGAVQDLHADNYTSLAAGTAAGKFVSLDAISGKGTHNATTNPASDMVVITWIDASDNLWFSYNGTDPQSDDSSVWEANKVQIDIDTPVAFNEVKLDSDGNAHIAYSVVSDSDLKYVKLTYSGGSYTAGTPVFVDSYQLTGEHMRLDIAKDANGKQVPYISYYAPATRTAKVAYQVNFTDAEKNGALDDEFTGIWEVSHIASPNTPTLDTINIGIHKTATGELGTVVSANGTKNPVFAYVVKDGAALERAQKK